MSTAGPRSPVALGRRSVTLGDSPTQKTPTKDQAVQNDGTSSSLRDMDILDFRGLSSPSRNANAGKRSSPGKAIISLGDSPVMPISFSSAEHAAFREWFSLCLKEHRAETYQYLERYMSDMLVSFGLEPTDAVVTAAPMLSGTPSSHQMNDNFTKKPSTTTQATIDNIIEGTVSDDDDVESTMVKSRISMTHRLHTVLDGLRRHTHWQKTNWQKFTHACPCFPAYRRAVGVVQEDLQAKEVNTKLFQRAVESGNLDLFVGMLIIVNSMVMVLQLEYYGHLNEVALGTAVDDGSWKNADEWFLVVEHIFNALFLFELAVRMLIYGRRFFKFPSLICDAVLVLLSSVQIYLVDVIEGEDDGDKVSMFRVLRFIRFVRVLRLVRVLKLFSSLRVLVKTVVSSFGALVWSMVLLLVIMVNGGLVLSVLLRDFIRSPENDMAARKWVFKHYGTATRAIYTLFEVTLAGCWPNYFRPLIDYVSVWYALFALVYVTTVVFAIIRIITAMFLKETLQMASEDAEMMVREKLKNKDSYIRKLGNVFKAVDANGDGKLNLEEFERIFSNQVVKAWLQVLELELHDAQALFNLLKNENDEITYDEFLTGLMRLKGQARTMDVVGLMHSADKTMVAVKKVQEQVNEVRNEVRVQGQLLSSPSSTVGKKFKLAGTTSSFPQRTTSAMSSDPQRTTSAISSRQ